MGKYQKGAPRPSSHPLPKHKFLFRGNQVTSFKGRIEFHFTQPKQLSFLPRFNNDKNSFTPAFLSDMFADDFHKYQHSFKRYLLQERHRDIQSD